MTESAPRYPTSLGTSDADTITLLGQDLAADLMGKVSFGELALWLVTQRRPTSGQVAVFEAVLVALADHGFTPTAIAARLTYLSAPDSVQGALAAGLLGGGSRFLGVTEDTGRFLADALAEAGEPLPADDAGWDAIALAAVRRAREAGRLIPGLGHPVHKVTDPRTPVLIRIAEENGLRGPHLRLFEAIGRVHPQVLGRTLPLNGAGTSGAALADLGLPVGLLRGFALLARTAGLLGQLAEEQRRPIGMDVYLAVDRNADYVPPDPPGPPTPRSINGADMATIAAVIASTHHPFYLRAPHGHRRRTGRRSRTSGCQDRGLPRDPHPGPPGCAGNGRQRPFPPALARQHAAVPDRQGAVLRRELLQRGAGVRPAPDVPARATRSCRPTCSAAGSTPASTWRSATSCGSTTASPARSSPCGPQADLPIVPVYTNIFAPPMPQPRRFVELGQAIRALVEAWPSDKRVAIIGTGHLSLELGGPRQFGPHGPDPEFDRKAVEWIASADLKSALAEVSLDSLWLPGNATHGFMDFMLMMGVAGENVRADYADSLDLFHTMEAYFTWYPEASC